MIWHKLKQVLRRLTGKKQTLLTSHSYITTSTFSPTPTSLTRSSLVTPAAAPNLSTLDSTSDSITSTGQSDATRSSALASVTATTITAASSTDSAETEENTDVFRNLIKDDIHEHETRHDLDRVTHPHSSVGIMQQGNVQEWMAVPPGERKDRSSSALSTRIADMDLFDASCDSFNFQSLAAGAATITASMPPFDCKLARTLVFEDQQTVEHFHSLGAAAAVLNESAKSVIEGSASGPSTGSSRTTSTVGSATSSYSSAEGELSASSNPIAPATKLSDERSHILQSAADIIHRNFGTYLDVYQTEAVFRKASIDSFARITTNTVRNAGLVEHDAEDRQPDVDVSNYRLRLTTARNLRRKTLFAERTNTSSIAVHKEGSQPTPVIVYNYRTAVESLKAAAEARAATRKTAITTFPAPVVFQNFRFTFEYALPERPAFAPAYPRTFAERHKAFAARLASIANYTDGEFVDPGAPDGGPSVEEQLHQEQTLSGCNMAAFEGADLLGDSDWFPTGFHCTPAELITMEEKVRHMGGQIGHQWAFYMSSMHPNFRAEAWAQEDLLQAMGISGCLHRKRIHAYLDPVDGAQDPWAHADVLRKLEREFLWQTVLYAHAMNDLRTVEWDPLPVDEVVGGGDEVSEWADSEGEEEEGDGQHAAWLAKMKQRRSRKTERTWGNIEFADKGDCSDEEAV